jgi:subtilisin family serine protease
VARFLTLVTGALVVAGITCPVASAADRIVVKHRSGLTTAERVDLRDDADVRLAETLPITGVEVVKPEDGDTARALSDLREDPDVLWAEADQRRQFLTDPLAPLEWGLDNTGQAVWGTAFGTADADIDAPEAWTVTEGAGATVAVVDTGVDTGHPDLTANLLPGKDFVDDDSDPFDGNGHGTHVTGTIAAEANDVGTVGVAPQANVIPLRVLDNSGNGWGSDVAAAFAWAGDHGVRIVNASLGSGTVTRAEQQAIHDHPATLYVVAAGNSSRNVESSPQYPCAYTEPNVICVGASDFNDDVADFSNYGATSVDLFAPGALIASTLPLGRASNLHVDGYGIMQGTSMATPHVAGAAALVESAHPGFAASQIKAALLGSVDKLPAFAGKSLSGGRLNAAAALDVEPPLPASAPAPTPTPTPPPVAPAKQPATTPTPAPAPPVVVARLSRARVSGRAPRATLRFTSSAATRVTIRLRRLSGHRWRAAGTTTAYATAGVSRWHVGRSIAGLRLRKGTYKLTLSSPGGSVTVKFRSR